MKMLKEVQYSRPSDEMLNWEAGWQMRDGLDICCNRNAAQRSADQFRMGLGDLRTKVRNILSRVMREPKTGYFGIFMTNTFISVAAFWLINETLEGIKCFWKKPEVRQ